MLFRGAWGKTYQGYTLDNFVSLMSKNVSTQIQGSSDPESRGLKNPIDSRFYEQALPILMQLEDHQNILVTCVSGIENHISMRSCYKYLDMLCKENIVVCR